MSQPSNGITAEVIRGVMPPHHLSADLLQATFAALPPPPPDSSRPWREARITWLIEEIVAPKPADAEQARIAAQLLILRELANSFTTDAHVPGLTIEQRCQIARSVAALHRTAVSLDRSLARHQQKPVPFFGTVVKEAVDISAVDAAWRRQPTQPDAAPHPQPASAPPPAPLPAARPDRSPDVETQSDRDAAIAPEWTITKLDEDPG